MQKINQRFGLFPSRAQDPSSPFINSEHDSPLENSKTLKSAVATEQHNLAFQTAPTDRTVEAASDEKKIVRPLTGADKEHKTAEETCSSESSSISTVEIRLLVSNKSLNFKFWLKVFQIGKDLPQLNLNIVQIK